MTPILDQLAAHRIVPVVVADSAAQGDFIADALARGGLAVAEVTFRTAAAPDAIAAMAARGDVLVGAGTVVSPDQVDTAVAAGARFIVSPGFRRDIAERAREHEVAFIPGAVTATEIMAALEAGVHTVKFFPAETSGGIAALRALAAPFGAVSFLPTGGVGPSNLADYLAHPRVLAVGGSWMLPARAVAAGDAETIVGLTAEAVALVRAADRRAEPSRYSVGGAESPATAPSTHLT